MGAAKLQREKNSACASCVTHITEIGGLINTPRPPAAPRDLLASCATLAANPVSEHLELTCQALLSAAALFLIREFCVSCTRTLVVAKVTFI